MKILLSVVFVAVAFSCSAQQLGKQEEARYQWLVKQGYVTELPNGNAMSRQLTLEDMQIVLKKLGIKHVIRLNGNSESETTVTYQKGSQVSVSEEEAVCKRLGATFEFVPLRKDRTGKYTGTHRTHAKDLSQKLVVGRTLIHCKWNKDRSCCVVGLYLKNIRAWKDRDVIQKLRWQNYCEEKGKIYCDIYYRTVFPRN